MAKRGRGRPRKIPISHCLSEGDELMVKSDKGVIYYDKLPEFFKIYVSALCSQTMRVPGDFIEKVGENIGTRVRLRRRTVCGEVISWKVEMKRNNNNWFLEKGWPQFVKDNSIEEGDFMTFSYEPANSMFFVKLFATNGCTKRLRHQPTPQNAKVTGGEGKRKRKKS